MLTVATHHYSLHPLSGLSFRIPPELQPVDTEEASARAIVADAVLEHLLDDGSVLRKHTALRP